MNRTDSENTAVRIANPKTLEFQIVRTSLIPGLLKTVRENRSHTLPLKIFEASDVAVKDLSMERQSRNMKHAAAVWCNKTAGFEMVHGLLDRIMQMLDVPFIGKEGSTEQCGYYIKECQGSSFLPIWSDPTDDIFPSLFVFADPAFFPGRVAHIFYRKPTSDGKTKAKIRDDQIGVLGIIHPTVLTKFEITFPCSALEFTLEPFI
jgi:phenylalanyl-tRNA synthetase beta chain